MKRISIPLSGELEKEIADLAAKEKRKVAPMAVLLLQQAIRERNRKKKKGEKSDERTID